MCKMYGIIEGLCADRGIKPGKMCADLGISRGIMGDLKAGRTKKLSAANIEKISNYFGISSDYLIGNAKKAPTPVTESGPARNIIKIAGRDGSFVERELTDDQVALMKNMLDQLKPIDDDRI